MRTCVRRKSAFTSCQCSTTLAATHAQAP